ncbi:SEC-C domain-containing protein [Pelomonas sp. CA6]|uniref:YchJ family protein n=1 Tax=Pelomonas sp. CA6 TaxID=2907999 RepID=UPI001F4B126A|nr:YchJ family metal-binding protein [Pelomonas sp. CA6]MCH7342084.1 SEC-C domain-containing protein [Pelomonas sp. CA6]
MSRPPTDADCPCGSGLPYEHCCGALHARHALDGSLCAIDAQALMRSRYSAYVRGLHAYLRATWHPSTRPDSLEPDDAGLRWLGLQVKAHRRQDDSHATVHFVARSKLGGRAHRLEEISRFVRENGVWYYVDGDFPG